MTELQEEIRFTICGMDFECLKPGKVKGAVFVFRPLTRFKDHQEALDVLFKFLHPHLRMPFLATNLPYKCLEVWTEKLQRIENFALVVEEETEFSANDLPRFLRSLSACKLFYHMRGK